MALFIALSAYQRPAEELALALPEHRDWIEQQYVAGVMLASGRQNPPTGGVMILRATDRDEAAAVVADDPFSRNGLAAYEIREFEPTPFPWRSHGLDAFLAN